MNKKIIIAICVLLAIAVPVGAIALNSAKTKPETVSGGYFSTVVDRLNISVDGTEFTYAEKPEGDCECTFILTVSKTEPDFFGEIESLWFDGIENANIVFESLGDTPDGANPEGLVLSAKDDKPIEYSWRVTVSAPSFPSDAKLIFKARTGLTKLTSETWEKEIPFIFSFSDAEENYF